MGYADAREHPPKRTVAGAQRPRRRSNFKNAAVNPRGKIVGNVLRQELGATKTNQADTKDE
jgi:hypothetical protein